MVIRVSFRKLSKGLGPQEESGFYGGGGMMVNDVAKSHKRHLGGQGMLECVWCVHSFIQEFLEGGENSKVRLSWWGYIAHNNWGGGGGRRNAGVWGGGY